MASKPKAEDCARELLDVFKDHGCKDGEMLMINTFIAKSNELLGFKDGLDYAVKKDWILIDGNKIFLTAVGYKEM